MLSFLQSLLTQYLSSKCTEIYSIWLPMSLFLCKMSSFVCVFICSIASCSPSPFALVVDISSITMIPPTPPWLNYVYTEKKENLYVVSFSFSFSLLRCRQSSDCWEYHLTALWTPYFSFLFIYPTFYKINVLKRFHINDIVRSGDFIHIIHTFSSSNSKESHLQFPHPFHYLLLQLNLLLIPAFQPHILCNRKA